MEKLEPKDIFRYWDYKTFLKEYFESRVQINPQWSYNSWAKKMKLANSSNITRIINGDRHPGDFLLEAIKRDIQFDHEQFYFFELLIQLQKNDGQFGIRDLLRERIIEIKEKNLDKNDSSPHPFLDIPYAKRLSSQELLYCENATSLILTGKVDKVAVDNFLNPLHFIPQPIGVDYFATINFTNYTNTPFGDYSEIACSTFVIKKGDPQEQIGCYYFNYHTNSKHLKKIGNLIWDNDYKLTNLEIDFSKEVKILDKSSAGHDFNVDFSLFTKEAVPAKTKVLAYNSHKQQRHCYITASGLKKSIKMNDFSFIKFKEKSYLKQFIDDFSFSPIELSLYNDFKVSITGNAVSTL